MKKTLVVFFTLFAFQCLACINEYRTLLSGEIYEADGHIRIPSGKTIDKERLTNELSKFEEEYGKDVKQMPIKIASDIGVILIYLGRVEEAIEIYRDIEKKEPGLYATAANIGTSFELIGQNDSALHYIKRAISINPVSHDSSEWIHVNILERKVLAGNHQDVQLDESILGLNFGEKEAPENIHDMNLRELEVQLTYQLEERMTFIKPEDVIVGEILFDLGNVKALTDDVETALAVYDLAITYGFESDLMSKRISFFKKLAFGASVEEAFFSFAKEHPWITLIGLLLIVSGMVWFVIRIAAVIRFRLTSSD